MHSTFIIAEAGVNHNGDESIAFDLIDAAIDAGANAIKFQTFRSENLTTKKAKKAPYQIETSGNDQLTMLKKLELSFEAQKKLKKYCDKKNICFLSTAFDLDSLNFLVDQLNLDILKIPSGELNNAPLILEYGRSKKKIIMSTGMSTVDDIKEALGALAYGLLRLDNPSKLSFADAFESDEGQSMLKEHVSLLHCSSQYPTEIDDSNLRVMNTLNELFGLQIGFSDHTQDQVVAISAVALGAKIIEKHITIDKNMDGPDHSSSANLKEFKEYVKSIRTVEKILGSSKKRLLDGEVANQRVARKSIVAIKNIKQNEIFSNENITTKRPGDGMSPIEFWTLLGTRSSKDYSPDDQINE